MTYLQLVNSVLRRLRESEVNSVAATDYSKLIGDFVNDAVNQIESAWDWSQLRSVITVATVNGTGTYALSGFTDASKLLGAVNDTSNVVLEYRPRAWLEEQIYINGGLSGEPKYYTFAGVDGSGDAQVTVYPTPDAVYSLRFDSVLKDTSLSADTDTLAIPHLPVVHLALALAARERGENGGTTTQEFFFIADRTLNDAIAMDAARHPEETVWYTP